MTKPGTVAKVHNLGAIIAYEPNTIVSRSILKKITGAVDLVFYDAGVELAGTVYPFETFLLLLEGTAVVTIDKSANHISPFHGIVIPAHTKFMITALEKFKMLTVVIKSGYE